MKELKTFTEFNVKNWERELLLVIYGIPMSKQSMRHRIIMAKSGKKVIGSYQSNDVISGEMNVVNQILLQLPGEFKTWRTGGVVVKDLQYVFPILKGFSKKKCMFIESGGIVLKTTKPDLTDNLNKGLFDAMEGVVFNNDSMVCAIYNASKFFGANPRTVVHLQRVDT